MCFHSVLYCGRQSTMYVWKLTYSGNVGILVMPIRSLNKIWFFLTMHKKILYQHTLSYTVNLLLEQWQTAEFITAVKSLNSFQCWINHRFFCLSQTSEACVSFLPVFTSFFVLGYVQLLHNFKSLEIQLLFIFHMIYHVQ